MCVTSLLEINLRVHMHFGSLLFFYADHGRILLSFR